MYLDQVRKTRLQVQAVNILRDHMLHRASALQGCERVMTFMRLRLEQSVSEIDHVCVHLAIDSAIPPANRVCAKTPEAIHRRLSVAGPESVLAAECGYSAFDRHAGARHCDHITTLANQISGSGKRLW